MTAPGGAPPLTPGMPPRPKGRFVAGATCPRCSALDRVQVDVETGLRRWCVACDFDETLAPALATPAGLAAVPVLPVRIFEGHADGTTRETK